MSALGHVLFDPPKAAPQLVKDLIDRKTRRILLILAQGVQQVTGYKTQGVETVIDLMRKPVRHGTNGGQFLGLKKLFLGTAHIIEIIGILYGQCGLVRQNGKSRQVVFRIDTLPVLFPHDHHRYKVGT